MFSLVFYIAQVSSSYAQAPYFDVVPSVGSVTSTGFTPSVSIDEAGYIYYVVVANDASAPTAAEVKAGTASGGWGALEAASEAVSSSPFTSSFSAMTSLSAGTEYDVYFVAEDNEGTRNLQSSVTKVDATTLAAAPTANAGLDQTVASSASVTLDGSASSDPDGDTLTYTWTQTSGIPVILNSPTAVQPTFTAPTLSIGVAAATLSFSLTVNDGTVDSTVDTVLIIVNSSTNSPASEFAAKEDATRSVITSDAQRTLNSTVASNTRLTRDARGRFLTSRTQMQSDGAGLASRNNIALDVDGITAATPEQLSTQGMFFAQTGNFEGTQRRLVFGDFDIQRDGDTGSTTATINGKVAWEQMLSEQTMLGYYLGGEVARSNIQGSFTGTQDKYGVSVGGYFVHALQEHVFLDGFITVGAGRNNLEIADNSLDLTSDYTTRTATMGAAVSGVYEYGQYDFHPELAFSYGKTWIGDVGFTGVAYGLTDDTLSLDAGDVSIANLTLRPEIVWALDAETVADSNTQLSFAPRFICQRTSAAATTQDCGAGAEIGLSSTSEDGLSSANIRLVMDRVGTSNRSSFALNFERRF